MGALTQLDRDTAGARTADADSSATGRNQYLTFMLGGEVFAIGILSIKEIIEYGGLTEVPMMPDCIRGVINLRGAVVPVMDLSVRFGKQPIEATKRTCFVIVEIHNGEAQQVIGVVVDAVSAVIEIGADQIAPAPNFGARIRRDFIAGMGKVGERFVILLNVEKVLSTDELGELSEFDDGAAAQPDPASAAQ
ncbi:MAG: chemotaxis protein CheW [Pseudomonadota bacterium]